MAEKGATAPELCAIFGWSKLETAEIYIREAQKRRMVSNAFARLDEYRNRKSVSVHGTNKGHETKKGKSKGKSNTKYDDTLRTSRLGGANPLKLQPSRFKNESICSLRVSRSGHFALRNESAFVTD